jgi:hypothetical protein
VGLLTIIKRHFTDILLFFPVGTTGQSSQIIAAMKKLTRSLNGSGSASVLGQQSANRDCYNLRQAPLGSPSMGSRTYRDLMVHDDLLSRNLEILLVCLAVILVLTG